MSVGSPQPQLCVAGELLADAEELLADGVETTAGAVRFTGVSRSALYAELATGRLRTVKKAGRRLWPRRELVRWLAEGLE